jgi:hypothetical protein
VFCLVIGVSRQQVYCLVSGVLFSSLRAGALATTQFRV